MNPGAIESGEKVATGFMEAMKTQPLALALAVMNILLMGLFFYVAQWAGTNRRDEFQAIMEMQKEVQKLLYNCTPLASSQRYKPADSESHPVELPPLPQPRPPEAQ